MNRLTKLFFGLWIGLTTSSANAQTSKTVEPMANLYDIKITAIDGKEVNLADFKGKKILFVNVASECGFTPQYKGLQELHEKYKDQLVIIGLPCNQFGGQEPGDANEIQSFCQKNYGVDFLITEKIEVKGENQHPLYQWLTTQSKNGKMDSEVKWNFQKYMVDEEGKLINVFYSNIEPVSEEIISLLSE